MPAGFGVTYDANTNSLWMASVGNSTGVVADYSLSGALLSSFTPATTYSQALAYDPSEAAGVRFFGGEFDESIEPNVEATPEPGSVVLLATGLLGVIAAARRRRVR